MSKHNDQITVAKAEAAVAKLKTIGVPITTVEVQTYENGTGVLTPVGEFDDDGLPHQILVNGQGWSDKQNLGLALTMLGHGGFDAFQHFFVSAYAGDKLKAISAVLGLTGVLDDINKRTAL